MAHRRSFGRRAGAAAIAASAVGAIAIDTHADEAASFDTSVEVAPVGNARSGGASSPDRIPSVGDGQRRAIDRTWLYIDDARVAAPMVVVAASDVSYTATGASPTRIVSPYPNVYKSFAGNTAQPGGMVGIGAEVGLWPRVSFLAAGEMGFGGFGPSPDVGAVVGVRVQLLPVAWRSVRLVASGGYIREAWQGPVYKEESRSWLPGSPRGDNGAWLQLAVAGDVKRLHLAGTVHAEHIFAEGRDAVDLLVEAGASYRILGGLRAGIEYVGQDLEEIASPAAESGARHFIGPTASMQLMGDRLTIAAGPAFGLSELSPRILGRMAIAYAF